MSAELREAVRLIEAEIYKVGKESGGYAAKTSEGYFAWRDRNKAACEASKARLVAAGVKVRDQWDSSAITFCGSRSSSTGGYLGALQNWRRAAHVRLETGAH